MANNIIEFFKDQNVFITGGTGFLGRVLVEKLLRCTPDIGNIYVMMREKNNKDLNKRLEEMKNLPLFDIVKSKYPENLQKIVPVNGDCKELGLGLSEYDRQILEENVSIVFHCAASVRFDEPIKNAIFINTRGTIELMMLARKMKLKVLVHVSTIYCNYDKNGIEERLYPAPVNWRKFIEVVENTDVHTLNILTSKILDNFPNTYLFSKSLSEHVVKDLRENIPVVIIRPSIVTSTIKEPFSGWIDNFNGPVGLLLGGGKGLVRSALTEVKNCPTLDCVPVDIVIKVMCITAWITAKSGKQEELPVYHVTATENIKISLKVLIELAIEDVYKKPMRSMLWLPRVFKTNSRILFSLHVIFLQVIPALFLDFLLQLNGKKPMLVKLQRKIFLAFMAVQHFTINAWTFKTDKTQWLQKQVTSFEEPFNLNEDEYNINSYFADSFYGATRFLLNQPSYDTKAKRELQWMKRIEKIILTSTSALLLWWVYHKAFLQNILFGINDAFNSLIESMV